MGRRLDRILRIAFPGLSLALVFSSLRKGIIRVNGSRAAPDYRIQQGDSIDMPLRLCESGGEEPGPRPPGRAKVATVLPRRPGETDAPAALSGLVIFSSRDLLFLNKPRGLLVHGPESLESLVLESRRSDPAAPESLAFRPGPLHRLDRNTSGLVTFPNTAAGARVFTALLRERQLRKFYLALLEGRIGEDLRWNDKLSRDGKTRITAAADAGSGREASTRVTPLALSDKFTFVCIEIHTGLTHQIRAHAALHGHPLAGDVKYGGKRDTYGYFLHSWKMVFTAKPFPDVPLSVTAEPDTPALGRLTGIFGKDLPGTLKDLPEVFA